jgi:prepilin-type N-terminal cleavage/methylation domain-containing protein
LENQIIKTQTMKTQTIKHSQSSFTLIELLVVIAIIGILAGMIFVNVSGVIERAKIARSLQFSDSLRNALIMNLVSEWKFDENSGTIAKDFWGGNNGTLVNGPTWKTGGDCVSGSCLQFDGSNDYVDCGNGESLTPSGNFTLESWIKTTQQQHGINDYSHPAIMGTKNLGGTSEDFILENTDGYLAWYDEFGAIHYHKSSKFIADNQWHHVLAERSGSAIYLFCDGKIVDTIASGSTAARNHYFEIGRSYWDSNTLYFNGLIDEVRIYNAALPTAQIQQHYAEGLKSLLANNAITEQEYAQRISDFNQVLVKN